MILHFSILASVGALSSSVLLTQSDTAPGQGIATGSGSMMEESVSAPLSLPPKTYIQPSSDGTLYCRRDACQTAMRRRSVKRLKFRYAPPAVPATHGGEPATVDDLQERFGAIPHRLIRRIRRDLVKSQTAERDKRLFELRALQKTPDAADTVSTGKKNCRSQNVCIDPVQQRRERRENEQEIRGGKAKERANFFSGGGPRTKDDVTTRYGRKYLERPRNVKPIAERGLRVPRKRDLRTY